MAALDWLRDYETTKITPDAPRDVISKPWRRYVLTEAGEINHRAYTFCVLDSLLAALQRRDVFITPSWRYADPHCGIAF